MSDDAVHTVEGDMAFLGASVFDSEKVAALQ
jgi:hypothetical protein